MVRTRQGTAVPARGSVSDNSTPKEPKPAKKRGASDREPQQQGRAKKRKSSPGPSQDASGPSETREAEDQQHLPRLTTPDLEFDWDRSKLKDPRQTPGRERRPRYDTYDIPAELAARRPPSPEKPKGRLNAIQKDKLFDEKTRRDPAESFHDLYKCRDKGPNGSPTYDSAGFRLDYEKVMNWFKPVRYNKSRMINGMDRAVARGQSLNDHMMQAFFEEDLVTVKEISKENVFVLDLVKDSISKDLGTPLHKIDHAEIDMWEEKGYKKHKVEDWVTYSDEDKKRSMKMLSGASLRA
ncbi:hypothetical protein J7T55_006685 [Diaporthe amygdali]|uniref:uncharacterized protein n=1 Tax=Phomopsis amygdali TaxID=1214568 RepID=UPI0022FDBAAB|nr:uncharacterized protein J7T55_006685 [Diaporthe amygdali]KAJ0125339.1 hypothetical protein J7T55_006685 [Diaporthe amygdali]